MVPPQSLQRGDRFFAFAPLAARAFVRALDPMLTSKASERVATTVVAGCDTSSALRSASPGPDGGKVKETLQDSPNESALLAQLEEERRARRAAESAVERALRLQRVTSDLGEVLDVAGVIAVVLEQGAAQYDATSGSVVLLDGSKRMLRLAGSIGLPGDSAERWGTFSVDAEVPLAEAVRTKETVVTPSLEAMRSYRDLTTHQSESKGFVSVPLLLKGEVMGGMGLSFGAPNDFSADDIAFIEALAQQCAQALDRIRLYDEERAARRVAEQARERLAFLAEASDVLAGSLDYTSTLARVARLAVPKLADWCAVEVVDTDGTSRSYTVEHVDPAKVASAYQLRRDYPPDPDADIGSAAVVRTGQPQLISEITDEILASVARDERHLELMRQLSIRSLIVVPLSARGRTLGTLTLVSSDPERIFAEEDMGFAMDLARRAATAVDNASLYEERSHVARVLQRTLLPAQLPFIPGVEMAARYRPAAERHGLGGDFYDAFLDADRGWAIVVGDVQGKGANAAAVTGLIRHTLRASAMHQTDPGSVISILNDVLLQEDVQRFCTVAYMRLDLTDEGVRVCGIAAGHPTPYILRADGSVEEFQSSGMLVGVFEDYESVTGELYLAPGDAVVLYTDGVTDQRAEDAGLGEDGLRSLLEGCTDRSADDIAEAVANAAGGDGPPFDDVAVLVFKVET